MAGYIVRRYTAFVPRSRIEKEMDKTEHGDRNVGRKLIRSFDDSPDMELEILLWCEITGGLRYSYYNAKDTKGTVYRVMQSDFESGVARWVRSHARDCDGKPCECGANPTPKLPVWQAFAKVWAQAKLDPAIDEEAWKNLESEILALIYRDAKDCSECTALREEVVGPYYCVQHMK